MEASGASAQLRRALFGRHGLLLRAGRPAARIWLLVGAMALAAAVLLESEQRDVGSLGSATTVAVSVGIALCFFLSETFVIHLEFRREVHTLSFSEAPLVVGLFFVPPLALALALVLGAGGALALHRRQRPVKLAFNVAQWALGAAVAIAVFGALASPDADSPRSWAAAVAAASAASWLSILLIAAVVLLGEGRWVVRELPGVAATALTATFASASLALAGVALEAERPAAVSLLLVPGVASLVALKAYSSQRQKRAHLQFLYESMRRTQSATDLRSAVEELLASARETLRAGTAEIVLLADDGETALRSTLGPCDERVLLAPTTPGAAEREALVAVFAAERALTLSDHQRPHPLRRLAAERGLRTMMLAPFPSDEHVAGTLLVAGRQSDVGTFTRDDRDLLETLARHASLVLQHERLQEELRHRAFYDSLTNLPNRTLFTRHVEEAFQKRSRDAGPGVLVLDLDDFTIVNDRFGHGVGDELLAAVAGRLSEKLRPVDVPARLGGDEFAVLVPHARPNGLEWLARRLADELRGPYHLRGRELSVRVSVGVASSRDCESSDELLRNADLALLEAKSRAEGGYALYESRLRERLHSRHELASALRHAVDRKEIVAHYQPIVELTSGRTVAVEALARWPHDGGIVSPGEFIPVAEEAGLMVEVGRQVLTQACEQASGWQEVQPGLAVTVNLSPTEFWNPGLAKEVAATLLRTRLDPSLLVLEITEGIAITDPGRTVAAMDELREIGVRFALDDFGTGYSSLSYLCDFRFELLKIAKPLIDRAGSAEGDAGFLDAIVQLGASLGLQVIAEGIEAPQQAQTLRDLGCQMGQGFHFSRPLDAPAATAFLDRGSTHLRLVAGGS